MLTWKPIRGTQSQQRKHFEEHCPDEIKIAVRRHTSGTTILPYQVEVVFLGKRCAIFKQPGGTWSDNGGSHYISPWYERVVFKETGLPRTKIVWDVGDHGRLTKKERTRLIAEAIELEEG